MEGRSGAIGGAFDTESWIHPSSGFASSEEVLSDESICGFEGSSLRGYVKFKDEKDGLDGGRRAR